MKKDIVPKPLALPAPCYIVASYDEGGIPNAMCCAWAGVVCGAPPCLSISLRRQTYTHSSIMLTGAFTVNIPRSDQFIEADCFGTASAHDIDKFALTALTAVKSDKVNAPYIEEFPLNIECSVVQVAELGSHTQFIGRIMNIKADEELGSADTPMIEQIMPLIFDVEDSTYYTIGEKIAPAFLTDWNFTYSK